MRANPARARFAYAMRDRIHRKCPSSRGFVDRGGRMVQGFMRAGRDQVNLISRAPYRIFHERGISCTPELQFKNLMFGVGNFGARHINCYGRNSQRRRRRRPCNIHM